MKKIYTLLFSTASLLSILFAQTSPDLQFKKGDKLLGGSLNYSLQRTTYTSATPSTNPSYDFKYFNVGVSPSIAFFTKPNRVTGFSLLFNYGSSFPSSIDYEQKTNTYGAGFYKQYWNALGKNFYFNIQGKVGANYNSNKYIFPSTTIEKNESVEAYLSIDPGFAYRIKKRLVLDVYYTNFLSTSFAYGERRVNNVLNNRNYSFGASTGLQSFTLNNVVFGFRYVL